MLAAAVRLFRAGLRPGDPVGLTVRGEYDHLVNALALLRLGCPHVTLPSREPAAMRGDVAMRVKPVALVVDDDAHGLPGVPSLPTEPGFSAGDAEIAALPPAPEADAVALYLTSSGTTGRAKIIPATFRQLCHQAMSWQEPNGREVFYRPITIEFNNSKRQRLYVLLKGSLNVFHDAARPDIHEACERWGVTRLAINAAQARVLLDRPGAAPLPRRVQVRLGGAAVNAPLRRELIAGLTPNIHITYATSEFGSAATAGPELNATHPDSVGVLHPGVELEIVGDDGRPLPPGTPGAIRMRSAGMSTRYFDDEAATAKAFRDGWFHPGDVGRLDDGGRLFFEGRADDMLNLASINIFPAEIERTVDACPDVVESCAFSLRSGSFGDIPLVAVVARPGASAEAILRHAREHLGLRAPRKVFLVEALPRNAGGKVMREELRRRFQARPPEPQSAEGVAHA